DYRDPDDDGDTIPTRAELTVAAQAAAVQAFADTDGDGLPNYRDADDDGDGIPTALETRDTNGDGIPDYLDRNVDGSVGLQRVFLPMAAR
ncbi:MAG: hypothetical protein KDD83_29400, partial [Caldilineaceae bacterium]|nr:hypothetical protein [Caldilineaceae bacterium]